jgi:hypothetical protein
LIICNELGKLYRLWYRWEDNIKIDLKEICWESANWIDMVQVRDKWRDILNEEMNLHVAKNVGNFVTSRGNISFT